MSFKKFDGSTWQAINPKKLKGIPYTGTLPAVLTGTKAGYLHRYKIYGNTEQIGTPTPENPIVPSECGELETTGAHAGQYKLPLTSAGQNVDIYLGESQTTRRIRKLVLTGEETSWGNVGGNAPYRIILSDIVSTSDKNSVLFSSTHYLAVSNNASWTRYNACVSWSFAGTKNGQWLQFRDTNQASLDDFKSFLAAQYAAGTPVTIWYVLADPEIGTLNEPLRKIGDYADTIDSTQTSAQIPTSAGSTTISWAGEGLAPSEFDSIQEWVDIPTYTYTNGSWVEDN